MSVQRKGNETAQNETNEVNERVEREYLSRTPASMETVLRELRSSYKYDSKTEEELKELAEAMVAAKNDDLEFALRSHEYEARYKARAHNEAWRELVYNPLRPAEIRDSAAERIAGMLVQQSPDMAPAAIASRAYDIACALRAEAARRDAK